MQVQIAEKLHSRCYHKFACTTVCISTAGIPTYGWQPKSQLPARNDCGVPNPGLARVGFIQICRQNDHRKIWQTLCVRHNSAFWGTANNEYCIMNCLAYSTTEIELHHSNSVAGRPWPRCHLPPEQWPRAAFGLGPELLATFAISCWEV